MTERALAAGILGLEMLGGQRCDQGNLLLGNISPKDGRILGEQEGMRGTFRALRTALPTRLVQMKKKYTNETQHVLEAFPPQEIQVLPNPWPPPSNTSPRFPIQPFRLPRRTNFSACYVKRVPTTPPRKKRKEKVGLGKGPKRLILSVLSAEYSLF